MLDKTQNSALLDVLLVPFPRICHPYGPIPSKILGPPLELRLKGKYLPFQLSICQKGCSLVLKMRESGQESAPCDPQRAETTESSHPLPNGKRPSVPLLNEAF